MENEKLQSKEFNIPGDGHTFIGNANEVNITGPASITLAGEQAVPQEFIPFGNLQISLEDSKLLDEFKKDYAKIMEYCINTDFTSEFVNINLNDTVSSLFNDKWKFKSRDFKNRDLRRLKNKILKTLNELMYYVSPEFLRYHDASGMLIFRNQSWEEGCRLRNEFRPNSDRLRQEIANLYVELYPDEFADENV